MYHLRQLDSAISLLESFNGQGPFNLYLKKYFSENKKHGSKDRKTITALCYSFFRLGKGFINLPVKDKILLGLFLSDPTSSLLNLFKPEWKPFVDLELAEKLKCIGYAESEIFPFNDELSDDIDPDKYSSSYLVQPDLFIRIRPGYKQRVDEKLAQHNINYKIIGTYNYALTSSTKLEEILIVGKEVIVQDMNSQRVGELLYPLKENDNWEPAVWDCCAASGGKSIMAYDINPNIKLTVSDLRPSILENLNRRFSLAGIRNYTSFIADLTSENLEQRSLINENKKTLFDYIIADVPCTGSGTWSRTPESLYFFKRSQIDRYQQLQRKIIDNTIPFVSKGGHYLYITCSVFKKENEDQVAFIKKTYGLKLLKMEIFKGYESKADTMFAALFIKK